MEKHLELTIHMDEHGFVVDVYEPESGEICKIHSDWQTSPAEFDEMLCTEIGSWINLWKDEMDDERRV